MRHTSGWEPTPATINEPPGYISPFGRHYTSEAQDWEPPQWPPGLLPDGNPNPQDVVLPEIPPGTLMAEPVPFPEPPTEGEPCLLEEVLGEHVIDEDDIAPEDCGWNILLCSPITLPPAPSKYRGLART